MRHSAFSVSRQVRVLRKTRAEGQCASRISRAQVMYSAVEMPTCSANGAEQPTRNDAPPPSARAFITHDRQHRRAKARRRRCSNSMGKEKCPSNLIFTSCRVSN